MLSQVFTGSGGLGVQLARVLCSSASVQGVIGRALALSSSPPAPRYAAHAAVSHDPWYFIKREERLVPPSLPTGDEDSAFVSTHPSQKFANVLSQLRSHYPPEVWQDITRLYPDRKNAHPMCVDIAVGAEGRGGVELARRGFHVIGVEADPQLLARTFQFAQAHNAHIELMTAKVEHSLLQDSTADLVTFLHGLHLVDTHAALKEAWRLLKPHGRLIAAWNDRELSSSFSRELEDIMEKHVTTYNRFQKQRGVEEWGERLQEGGLFRLVEYAVHPNPIPMPSASALLDVLDCMSFIRGSLRGEARKRFNNDVRGLLERRYGRRAFILPLETKFYILEKIHEGENGNEKHANGKAYHHVSSHHHSVGAAPFGHKGHHDHDTFFS